MTSPDHDSRTRADAAVVSTAPSTTPTDEVALPDVDEAAEIIETVTAEIRRMIVGQDQLIRLSIMCLITEGHLLIEGVPGLGKTQLATSLATAVGVDWNRIQFTPDLMPADIVGTQVLHTDDENRREFRFEAGPVFANLLLADEINRATPKTQSALLEAMQERQVTAGGITRPLPRPFLVLATQNPIEQEGTYPLPEAQLDRFLLHALVGMPGADDLVEIMARTTGATAPQLRPVTNADDIRRLVTLTRSMPIPSHVVRFAAELVCASHPGADASPLVERYVTVGSSPRGAQALVLAAKAAALIDGRPSASIDDVRSVAPAALRHRLRLGFDAVVDGLGPDAVIDELLDRVAVPVG